MRSWSRALERINQDYSITGEIIPLLQIEDSALDTVLTELAEAAGQLALYPERHMLQLRIVK